MANLASLLITLLGSVLKVISPQLRDWITSLIQTLYEKAQETDNAFDDLAVELLAGLLDVDLE